MIQTFKLECLRKLLIFGQRQLDHILKNVTEYYNRLRSHTEQDHLPPIQSPPDEVQILESKLIVVRPYVGWLVKPYERKAD